MVDWTLLNNITEFSLNTTIVETSEDIIPNLITNTNDYSDGYYGLIIMTIMYLFLIYVLFRDDGDIRLDILRSSLQASGFVSIVGIVMLVSGLISSFVHVVWFLLIFLVQMIAVYLLKRKNQ